MADTTTTFLEANLAAHRARWAGAQPPAAAVSTTEVRVDAVDTPWPRVSLQAPDGRWLRVHSDRQPLHEASRWIAQSLVAGTGGFPSLLCIVGAGCGYVLDVLETEAPETTKLLVLEPEPGFVPLLLGRRDWTRWIEAGRLLILAGPTYVGRAEAWRLVDPTASAPLVLTHPVISDVRREAAHVAAQVIGQAVAGAHANYEARQRFAGRYLLNTLRNLPIFKEAGDVRALFGSGVGKPAIVAGAGPSLNQNLAALGAIPHWRDRVVFVSVDTALKPALAGGTPPHYVVGVDPGEVNARMLTDLPPVPDTALVAEASLDRRSFEAFRDRTYLFKVSETHHPWPWLATHGADVGLLRAWGSVLTTAFDFALRLGCDPVIFIGADLAYTNRQPHCRGTVYEEEWAKAMSHGATIEVVWRHQLPNTTPTIDLLGGTTQSSPALIAFRDWLATQIGENDSCRVINATGAGILAGPRIAQAGLSVALTHAPTTSSHSSAPWARTPVPIVKDSFLDEAAAALREMARSATSLPPPMPEWVTFTADRVGRDDLLAAMAYAPRGFPAPLE